MILQTSVYMYSVYVYEEHKADILVYDKIFRNI